MTGQRAATARPAPARDAASMEPDGLTGLPRRAALHRRLATQKPDPSQPATLALLQLANFYEIRQWVGAAESDRLLGEVANALSVVLPAGAGLFRCDHFEFAVLLDSPGAGPLDRLCERLREAVRQAGEDLIPPQLTLRCVVGTARRAADSRHPEILFARARQSLSRALPGRDSDAVYPGAGCNADRATLAAAIAEGGLEYSFQPLLHWQDERVRHFEMRCRLRRGRECWQGETLFETAVSHALGEALDRAAVLRAMACLSDPRHPGLTLTVNLTLGSLVSVAFLGWLDAQLRRHPDAVGRLALQLGEIDLLIGQHHAEHFSRALASLGLALSVRHFGCFEDPLGYLCLLRCARVRLDASLSEQIARAGEMTPRLQGLLSELATLDIEVVAGMLSELSGLPRLWEAGIAAVQGECIAPPLPEPCFAFPEETVLG